MCNGVAFFKKQRSPLNGVCGSRLLQALLMIWEAFPSLFANLSVQIGNPCRLCVCALTVTSWL